ncbi:MAG: DNA N-6-adenine-methyltransferase [Candidatus Babeliales bacterium]|jgi:site-specific DNA-methyltransferase (adenine-specific)
MIENPMLMVTCFKPLFSSADQNWRTPSGIYRLLDDEFHFDFDPCPSNPQFNGLEVDWQTSNFINPPYKDVAKWIAKGYAESLKGKLCVFLVASRTGTRWFQDVCLPHAKEIRFIKGRLRFGNAQNSAPFDSVVIVFDGRTPR